MRDSYLFIIICILYISRRIGIFPISVSNIYFPISVSNS